MEPTEKDSSASADENLSELLDSCLDDFNKPIPQIRSSNANQPKDASAKPAGSSKANKPTDSAACWSEEFKEFNKVMENFITDESELSEIQKFMGTLAQEGAQVDDETFTQSFAETLRELTQQAQNVPEASPEDLANLLGSLDMGDGIPSDLENMPEIMPLMQNVMQKLMSKELLYPSIKEIVDKYPGWLSENKDSLKTEDYENYKRQLHLMQGICEEFEKEIGDSETAKKEQFEKVLQVMQKIQTCGNPPKELISNIGPNVPLDEQGNLQLPGMPQQCVIM